MPWQVPIAIGGIVLLTALSCLAAAALVGALVFRGGSVMRLLRLELVTADGKRASRLRVLARAALAWAPVLLLTVVAISAIAQGEIKVSASIRPQADTSRGAEPRIDIVSEYEPGHSDDAGHRIGHALQWFARPDKGGVWFWLAPAMMVIMLAGAFVAIVNPSRGIQDRLAGTWIVPH
jgi:hypothetical protein